jgi:GtrA-like protein
VGALGIGVQLGTFCFLTHGLGADYWLATALAVETAVLHNFVWHERFTWADRAGRGGEQALARMLRFNLTTGVISRGGNLLGDVFAGRASAPSLDGGESGSDRARLGTSSSATALFSGAGEAAPLGLRGVSKAVEQLEHDNAQSDVG